MVAKKNFIAIALLLVSSVLWATAIISASNSGFFENEPAVEMMVMGGAISMVAAAIWRPWW
ncbi:MAG: hypothetical protein JRN51_09495 [Nitrososphaerota archaeon]|nr:hypothetical protein [Nitrososphaerota archaeon]